MLKRKRMREKGKIKFSRYFQKLEIGDKAGIIKELSVKSSFPKQIQGRTGEIVGKKGRCYIILIKIGKGKKFIVHPVHLKKLES
jgi:large subunit ribosomal protein L21e